MITHLTSYKELKKKQQKKAGPPGEKQTPYFQNGLDILVLLNKFDSFAEASKLHPGCWGLQYKAHACGQSGL